MNDQPEVEATSEPLHDLKEVVNQTYPKGWFVGIAAAQVLAAASSYRELESLLRARGMDPRTVLVIQAGVSVPDRVTIFA